MELVTKCEKERIGQGYNYDDAKTLCDAQEKDESKRSESAEKEPPTENWKEDISDPILNE